MTLLVSVQILGIVWSSTANIQYNVYGRSPFNALGDIPGTNDEPYSDRNIVCMAQGRSYVPMQLSQALSDPKLSTVVDTTGTSINGFRVCKREEIGLDSDAYDHFIAVCERIDSTLEAIQGNCGKVGYNVTLDALRIVDDITSKTTKVIPRALPILIMPYWDNAIYVHYAIPGWDGSACLFRLDGKYMLLDEPAGVMRAAPRSVRESKTVDWLGKPGGVWRNGWYEDPSGQVWFSDMMSTDVGNKYGIKARQFDTVRDVEFDCTSDTAPVGCKDYPQINNWGPQSASVDKTQWYNSLYISTGAHYGLFIYEGVIKRIVENKYSLETFISNVSIFVLLFRWFVSMTAMITSYRRGVAPWCTTGIGCLSSSRTFNVLPIMLLPRLKMTMAAFWTVGCELEGQQRALGEAWFAVYPAIGELMLLYFSMLNGVAKVTHRRMSDALFGPTVVAFALLHRFRKPLVDTGWLGYDGRIPTVIPSGEFEALKLTDLFTPDVAVRMSGNVRRIVYAKLLVLVLNLVPLLLSENMTRSGRKFRAYATCHIEKTLALRASNVGGLGLSAVYEMVGEVDRSGRGQMEVGSKPSILPSSAREAFFRSRLIVQPIKIDRSNDVCCAVQPVEDHASAQVMKDATCNDDATSGPVRALVPIKLEPHRHVLIGYELNRLGYLVFGGKYLISYDDWYILTSLAPLRVVEKLWNHRISVIDVTLGDDGYYADRYARLCRLDDAGLRGGACVVSEKPRLYRLNDPELHAVPWYDVAVCSSGDARHSASMHNPKTGIKTLSFGTVCGQVH